ncbi:MAG TPA: hypothetical protein VGM44_17940 [Polyangiaceae bacterium]
MRAENRHGKPPRARGSSKKRAARVPENGVRASRPEGWQRRLREQAHNLARALEMLEQAMAMTSEPKSHSLARAECLRGAGLLTLVAAAELLVVAGWYEADQAVSAGVLER